MITGKQRNTTNMQEQPSTSRHHIPPMMREKSDSSQGMTPRILSRIGSKQLAQVQDPSEKKADEILEEIAQQNDEYIDRTLFAFSTLDAIHNVQPKLDQKNLWLHDTQKRDAHFDGIRENLPKQSADEFADLLLTEGSFMNQSLPADMLSCIDKTNELDKARSAFESMVKMHKNDRDVYYAKEDLTLARAVGQKNEKRIMNTF